MKMATAEAQLGRVLEMGLDCGWISLRLDLALGLGWG